jgi:hypothetical protein
MSNNLVGIESVGAALREITPTLGITNAQAFNRALIRFSEAMVYSIQVPPGLMTFDKNVTHTINGITYNSYGFDIWNMARTGSGTARGPVVFNLSPREIRPHSVTLHTIDAWRNRSGNYSITLQRPESSDIVFLLMVK